MRFFRRKTKPIDAADLAQRTWRLDLASGDVIAPRVRLREDGGLSGHRHWNEWRWSIDEGALTFFSSAGVRTVIFDKVLGGSGEGLAFAGVSRVDPQHTLRLTEIGLLERLVPPAGTLALTGRRGPPRRRNLVVLRANEKSLHVEWTRNLPVEERYWDLCVSFYGDEKNFPIEDFSEYQVMQNKTRKFPSIYDLFAAERMLWDYDFFMFPDDDLSMSWIDLNVLFEVCREHRLDLAQPALTENSYISHLITLQQPGRLLRYVGYVEGMAPIFSIEALRMCLPTFRDSQSGWGIDIVWPHLLGRTDSRIAVIDRVAVTHTRPVGGNYADVDAGAELEQVPKEYGSQPRYIELGHLRSGIAWGSPQVGP